MLRTVIATAALLASVGVASADDVFSCRTLSGVAGPTLSFTIAHVNDTYSIADAVFEVKDGVVYSTAATDPANLATISGLNLDNQVSFNFRQADADVAKVNLVTRFEGGGDTASGNVSISDGGIFVLRCDVAHEG